MYFTVAGAKMTIAYSLLGSKYTGDGKVTLVANEASVEVFTTDSPSLSVWVGSITTSAKSLITWLVGVPSSTSLIWIVTGTLSSLVAKNISREDKNIPVSSTVNVCDSGSRLRGGGTRRTSVEVNESITPNVTYLASPRVIPTPSSPGSGLALLTLEVNLNVFVPFLNLKGGGGEVFGFLKKNEP